MPLPEPGGIGLAIPTPDIHARRSLRAKVKVSGTGMAVSMVTSSASTGTTSTVSGARASASAPKSASAIAVQVSALAKLFAAQPINRTLDETLLSTKLTSTAFPFITLPARGTVVQAYADGGTRVDSGDDSTLATYTLDAEDVKQPITLTLTPTSIGSLLPTTAADYLRN